MEDRDLHWKEVSLKLAKLTEPERNNVLDVMDVTSPKEASSLRICLRLWFHCRGCGEFQYPFEEDTAQDVREQVCLSCNLLQHS